MCPKPTEPARRRGCRRTGVLLALFLSLAGPAAAESPETEERHARDELAQATTANARAAAALRLGLLLAEGPAERRGEADTFFEQAIREANGIAALDARNAWGISLLRQERDQEAALVLSDLARLQKEQVLAEPVRARYLYNQAVALERTGPAAAVPVYGEALCLDPGLRKASDALARWSTAATEPALARTALDGLFGPLLASGRYDSAAGYLRDLASRESALGVGAADRLLFWAVRTLAASRVEPGTFREQWKPWLGRLGAGGSSRRAERIVAAYEAALPVVLEPAAARDLTAPWSQHAEDADAFAALLHAIGDAQRRQEARKAALSRYALAWSSAGDWQAAVFLTELVLQAPAELDPGHRIFDALLRGRLRDEQPPRDVESWRDLARVHALLAGELERRGAAGGLTGALGHWQQAVAAHEAANAQASAAEPAPGFYAGLAQAYRRAGETAAAAGRDRVAAEQYLALERPDLALPHFLQAWSYEGENEAVRVRLGLVLADSRDPKADAAVLDAATKAFVSARQFTVVERSRLDAVFLDQTLQNLLRLGQGSPRLVETLGVDLLGVVDVSSDSKNPETGPLVIAVRLIDVVTGKVIGTLDSANPGEEPAATPREASLRLARNIQDSFQPYGSVVKVAGKKVVVNLGSEAGVKPDDVLEVVRAGEPITHPVSGEVLPGELVVVGQLKVTSVSPQFATCELRPGGKAVAPGLAVVSRGNARAAPSFTAILSRILAGRGRSESLQHFRAPAPLTVAVVDFQVRSPQDLPALQGLAQDVTTSLLLTVPGVQVVTRDRVAAVRRKNLDLETSSGVTQAGRLLRADALVTGSLRYDIERVVAHEGYGASPLVDHSSLTLDLRILDVATGRVRFAKTFDARRSKEYPLSELPEQPLDLSAELLTAVLDEAQPEIRGALAQAAAGLSAANSFIEVPAETTPAGAALTLNGIDMGRTPLTLRLTPGPHEVVLELEGYQPRRFRIEAHPGSRIDVDLVPEERP